MSLYECLCMCTHVSELVHVCSACMASCSFIYMRAGTCLRIGMRTCFSFHMHVHVHVLLVHVHDAFYCFIFPEFFFMLSSYRAARKFGESPGALRLALPPLLV